MLGLLGACLAYTDRHAEALEITTKLHGMQASGYVDPFALCHVYLALNKPDEVIEYVQECLDERTMLVAFLDIDPIFDTIRTDSRFRKLAARVHSSELVPVGQK
jgi:hypothetical protein